MRDYSSTPNFWPLHSYARTWLTHMGYSHEKAPTLPYDAALTPTEFQHLLDAHPPAADGSWCLPHHPLLYLCFAQEGLVEAPGKNPNFCRPGVLHGLPPRWGAPGWIRKAKAIREKLLAFWRQSDYSHWQARLEYGPGDAPTN